MKIIPKILSLLLALVTVLSFAGCAFIPDTPLDPVDPGFVTVEVVTDGDDTVAGSDETAKDTDLPPPDDTDAAEEVTDAPTEKVTEEVTTAKKKKDKDTEAKTEKAAIDEDGWYTKKDDVALYIHTYGHLPGNFITKNEAEKLGWNGGGLDRYADGKSIGGDYFGNFEGLLPKKKGRKYTECDIGTMHKSSRGAKRIIFSNDGLIYYTDDHYETFTLLYGEE